MLPSLVSVLASAVAFYPSSHGRAVPASTHPPCSQRGQDGPARLWLPPPLPPAPHLMQLEAPGRPFMAVAQRTLPSST